jgi:hypothetical protein
LKRNSQDGKNVRTKPLTAISGVIFLFSQSNLVYLKMFSAQTKQIVEAFQLLEETDPKWLQAIVNRPTGSQWGQTLKDWTDIANLPWQPLLITDRINGLHLPQCVYYHYLKNHDIEQQQGLTGLHPDATENIKLLSEFDDFSSIRIEEGAHGLELVSEEVQSHKTEEAWLIIGPQRGKDYPPEIVWTAYPGRFAICAPAHKLWDGTLNCLSAIVSTKIPVAVKGINN